MESRAREGCVVEYDLWHDGLPYLYPCGAIRTLFVTWPWPASLWGMASCWHGGPLTLQVCNVQLIYMHTPCQAQTDGLPAKRQYCEKVEIGSIKVWAIWWEKKKQRKMSLFAGTYVKCLYVFLALLVSNKCGKRLESYTKHLQFNLNLCD